MCAGGTFRCLKMDLSNVDMTALARQLRKPEGPDGVRVGDIMAVHTLPMNMFVIEQMHIAPEDHLLEIGFGPGEAIAECIRMTPRGFVAGIDHSPEMLAMAEHRNHRAVMQERAELGRGDASDLPYTEDSFDKLFAVNVLHFWPDPAVELRECKRVLKPGGVAFFYLTHPSSWPAGLKESGVFTAREPVEVEEALREAGFHDVVTVHHIYAGGAGFLVTGAKAP